MFDDPYLHYRLLTLCPAPTDPVPRGLLTLWARAGRVYAYKYACVHAHARPVGQSWHVCRQNLSPAEHIYIREFVAC